jgi:hypothetical protein
MAKRQSRIPEKRREYRGEEFVQPLLNWFNLSPDKDGQARVGTIMGLYAALRNKRDDIPRPDDPRSPEDLEKALNQALRYFQLTPTISTDEAIDTSRAWQASIGWEPVPGSQLAKNLKKATAGIKRYARAAPERFYKDDGTAIDWMFMGEHDAMRIALRIIEAGWFGQVGPCTCGKIFFRRFKHQGFCSEKCRIAAFRSSDEARRRRNEYARELYHTKKALEEGKRR